MEQGVRLRPHPLLFFEAVGHQEGPGRPYSVPTHRSRVEIDGQYAGCSNTVES
jgi:hypothetical protein